MLKGNWHFIALSAVFSILALESKHLLLFVFLLTSWLIYLYLFQRISGFIAIITIVSFIFFYMYFPSFESSRLLENDFPPEQITLTGEMVSFINHTDTTISFSIKEIHSNKRMLVTYFYPDKTTDDTPHDFPYTYRSHCTITGTIEQPKEATNPFEFNYRKYLFEQGIETQIIVNTIDDIHCEQNNSFISRVLSWRETIMKKAHKHLHPDIVAWQQALLFGHSEGLDEEIKDLFQRWGLSHLLAISGLHVGIIMAIVYFILIRLINITKEQATSFILVFLPIYALIAGGQPSVWRASLMTAIILWLSMKRVKVNRLDILSIVFLILITVNKYIIYQIGFQFSFIVTLGLILSGKWFASSQSNIETVFKISFIAQMMIVPLQMYYFHHFQPLSIVLNVIIVPYFSLFVIPFMFFSLLLYVLPTLLNPLFEKIFITTHEFVLRGIILLDRYADIPFISGEISMAIAFIYYVLLIGMMMYLEMNDKQKAFIFGIAISVWLTYIIAQPYISKTGTVTMLDVGQGDAFVIELPYRKGVFLIDAGATFDFETFEPRDTVYKRVIHPYLSGRGIQHIDGIFVSHGHLDHHGSVRFILNDFNVTELFVSEYFSDEDQELLNWVERDEVRITPLQHGDEVVRKDHSFFVLSPQQNKYDENDNSLVLLSRMGGNNWLFTGDISESIEKDMLQTYPHLTIDILKVAHHGSHTSTAEQMLRKFQPTFAFIPVGKNNRYGHPSNEVLQSLEDYNIRVFRSDKHGAVQYEYKDQQSVIQPYVN